MPLASARRAPGKRLRVAPGNQASAEAGGVGRMYTRMQCRGDVSTQEIALSPAPRRSSSGPAHHGRCAAGGVGCRGGVDAWVRILLFYSHVPKNACQRPEIQRA